MIYVLIALALFGFLTMTLSRSNDQADGQDIDDEQAALYATELIEYVASAQNAVDMMVASGSEINDLNFVNPTSVGFNTTPPKHYNKVYHPQGGGLTYQSQFSAGASDGVSNFPGWYLKSITNVEWTPSSGNDVILSALRVHRKVCEIINKKITGDAFIPTMVGGSSGLAVLFDNAAGAHIDLDSTVCPECDGYTSMCVYNNLGDKIGFYNIIAAQ